MSKATGVVHQSARAVQELVGCFDTLSMKNGEYLGRRGFFYRKGGTTDALWQKVLAVYPSAQIIDSGEVWKAFRGSAPVSKQSHWWIRFRTGPQS